MAGFKFVFEDIHGVTNEIRIGDGELTQRALGRPPVLKRKHSGRIYGTSLEIYAECLVNGEFASFYTPDPTAYLMQLYRGNSRIWKGYVTPELYAEPDIAPPYDVQIVATDGLGELKLHNFEAQGDKTLAALFDYLLNFTGSRDSKNFYSSLSGEDSAGNSVSSSQMWSSAVINIDYKAGESCYDVLQYLLDTLCASITYHNCAWHIWRDNDVSASTLTSGAITSMSSGGIWPVGNLSTKIEPAKRQVTVEAPFHKWTPLVNPDMDADSGWTKYDSTYNTAAQAYEIGLVGTISQVISSIDMSVGLQVVTHLGLATAGAGKTGRYGSLQFQPSGSSYKFSLCDKNDGEGTILRGPIPLAVFQKVGDAT